MSSGRFRFEGPRQPLALNNGNRLIERCGLHKIYFLYYFRLHIFHTYTPSMRKCVSVCLVADPDMNGLGLSLILVATDLNGTTSNLRIFAKDSGSIGS